MPRKKVHDKEFELYIPKAEIQKVISEMAEKINTDLAGKGCDFPWNSQRRFHVCLRFVQGR